MEKRGPAVHLDQDEARAGSTPRVVRYMLLISFTLAIIALSTIWIVGAANRSGENGGHADTEGAVQESHDRGERR